MSLVRTFYCTAISFTTVISSKANKIKTIWNGFIAQAAIAEFKNRDTISTLGEYCVYDCKIVRSYGTWFKIQ